MAKKALLVSLQEALKWLAEPSAQQIDHLKDLGVWPSVDELALELDDVAPLLPEAVRKCQISPEVELVVKHVSEKLSGGDSVVSLVDVKRLDPQILARSGDWTRPGI